MSKIEKVEWHIVSNHISRKVSGWFGTPKYEVSTCWQTKLESGIKVQEMWKHKTFKKLNDALNYYEGLEEENGK